MIVFPLVSIVTPCYNAEQFIDETIQSVLTQRYTHWELIIVDDGSLDQSRDIIKNYIKNDKRIKLIINDINLGVTKSRNKAIKVSKGDYIAFLDSDDIWLPAKLEKQIELMQIENIDMSYSAYNIIDIDRQIIGHYAIKEQVSYRDMLKTSIIGTLTMVYNVKKLGKFYFHDVGHEDYVLKLEILKQIEYARGITEVLAEYRIVEESLSRNKLKTAKWQWYIYRKVEKLSIWKSIYYFIQYTYYGFRKYKKI